jgi:hypothetical protein
VRGLVVMMVARVGLSCSGGWNDVMIPRACRSAAIPLDLASALGVVKVNRIDDRQLRVVIAHEIVGARSRNSTCLR